MTGKKKKRKTTLLHTLSGTVSTRGKYNGNIYLNGVEIKGSLLLLGRCGIMMQEDLLVAELTVGELLNMAASLQLKHLSKKERKRRIKEAVEFLGLSDLIDRRIGTPEQGFLSGGQRRRVSLAIEGVLSAHKLIFLDEPTTGLSASDAAHMIELIQRLAKEKGTTIVFSIHQPRAQVFLECVDKLLLLHAGKTVYFGAPREVEYFFGKAKCAFPKRAFTNPADLMIDKMADANSSDRLLKYWPNSPEKKELDNSIENYLPIDSGEDENNEKKENILKNILKSFLRASYNSFVETFCLLNFGKRIFFRRKGFFVVAILLEFAYSILKGLLFSELKDNIDYFGDRVSSVFRSSEPGTSLVCLSLYVDLLPLSNRDLLVGRYGVISFCIMWIAIAFFRSLLMTFANLIVYYWLAGLQRELTNFLIFFGISFLYKLSFTGVILMVAAITSSTVIGGVIIINIEVYLYLTCGYFVSPDVMWKGLKWMTNISMFYYAYEGLSWTDISTRSFSCIEEDCPISGSNLLQSIGYKDRLSLDFSVLFLWAILPIFIFCVYVIVVRVTMQHLRTHKFYTHQKLIDKSKCENNIKPMETDVISSILRGVNYSDSDSDSDDYGTESDEDEIDDEEYIRNHNAKYGKNHVINIVQPEIEKDEKEEDLRSTLKKKPTLEEFRGIHPSMSNILSVAQMHRQSVFIKHSLDVFKNSNGKKKGLLGKNKSKYLLPTAYFRLENIQFEITKSKFSCFPFFRDEKSKITLLHNISGFFEPGSITAIMGNSGSGKTALLHSICGYLHTNRSRKVYGNIFVENELVDGNCWPMNVVSFMGQFAEDYIFPGYTVEETLLFAVQLQLPLSISYTEKIILVKNILNVLRLWEVKDNIIGPIGARGVSGGQLRRLSLAMEILLRRSKIYLLDEPTSGLSASGAAEIISVLQSLAKELDCTVIVTIHQPRTEILEVFDRIIVLSNGYMIYNGTGNQIENYFERRGYPLDMNDCIADSMMDQIVADEETVKIAPSKKKKIKKSPKYTEIIQEAEESIDKKRTVNSIEERILVKNFKSPSFNHPKEYRDLPEIRKELRKPWYTPTWFQMLLLAERRWILFIRSPFFRSYLFILAAFCSFSYSLFYLRIPNTAENVQYIMGAAIVSCNLWLHMNTANLFLYYEEKRGLLYELAVHRYRPISSYSTHFLFCLTESAACCLIYTTIVFWTMGLGNSFWSYSIFYLANVITGWIVLIVQYTIIWYFNTIDKVTNVTTYFIFFLGLDFSGYICHIQHIPKYIRWITWISLQRYLAEIMYFGILVPREYPCEDGESSFLVPTCPAPGKEFYLKFGYDLNPVLRDCLIVLGVNFVFLLLGYFICKSCIITWTIHPIKDENKEK